MEIFSSASSAPSAVNKRRNTLAFPLIIIFIIFLATFLRFHLLDAQSFWNDEGNTARLSERSLQLIIEGTASDIHPPLYYILLRGWRELVGASEFALRSFSVFAGILTVAVTMALGRMVGGKRPYLVAIVAGLGTAVNPALVYYSQEARMYALLGLLAVLATLFLVKYLAVSFQQSAFSKKALLWAGAYVLCAAAGLYTQYFFPTVLVAHNLLVLLVLIRILFGGQGSGVGDRGLGAGGWGALSPQDSITHHASRITYRLFFSWCAMMLIIFLLYLPWLPVFIGNFGSGLVSSREALLPYLRDMIWWMGFGRTLPFILWAFVVLLLVIGLGIVQGGKRVIVPLICLLVPMTFILLGATTPELFKFLVVAVPFMMLIIGLGFFQRGGAETQRGHWGIQVVSAILLLLLVLPTVQSLNNLYSNPDYARADYRGMVQRILDENHPNTGIILNAPNQWEVFTYYYADDTAVYPMPEGLRHQPAEAFDAWVQAIADKDGRIYLILWGETEWDPERRIERWLDAHAFKATDEWVKDVRFVTYAIPSLPATELETELNYGVGDEGIVLRGFTLADTELSQSDIVEVTLFWETAVPLTTRSKIFLHLLDANGQLVAQRDSEPGGGLALTTTWQPAQVVVDNHGILIPHDLPVGEYTLNVGMYDIADSATRLPIQTEDGTVDTLPLVTIVIR